MRRTRKRRAESQATASESGYQTKELVTFLPLNPVKITPAYPITPRTRHLVRNASNPIRCIDRVELDVVNI